VAEVIFRHPLLNFATTHLYDSATIDNPKDTLGPALATGRLVREALGEMPAARPFFDSEHGPIYTFNNRRRTLPEAFDDTYFRHMQWAHLASGGAGGGLRWPYRQPHVLTHGMRAAQRSLAAFAQLLDWPSFQRRNLNHEVQLSNPAFAAFACGDARQAVVWLLRQDRLITRRSTRRAPRSQAGQLTLPGLAPGPYHAHLWDTAAGAGLGQLTLLATADGLHLPLPTVGGELAVALVPVGAAFSPFVSEPPTPTYA
jgi:mannan endo-1,4-beta-mannosidase